MVDGVVFSGRWSRWVIRPVAIAATFVYVGFLCSLVLQGIFPYPFLFLLLGAVMGSAWFGGATAGIFAVIFSTALAWFFFVPPYFSFAITRPAERYFAAYIVSAIGIGGVTVARKQMESRIREARDLLEVKVAERTAELQASVRELRELTEAIPQQIWRADFSGRVEYCNSHLLRYTGLSQDEICGEGYFQILHGDDAGDFRDAWASARSRKQIFEGEWRVRGKDGAYRWFLVRAVGQEDAEGRTRCWYGTHIDIENWRTAELALAESQTQLTHINQIMSMGEVTASIAHQISQPLAAILANGYACLEWINSGDYVKAHETAESIVEDGTRAGAIVTSLRALFWQRERMRCSESVNDIVIDTVRLLRDEAIRHGIRIVTALASDLPEAKVDKVQIQQALLNLARNGIEAMADCEQTSAELELRTERYGEDEIRLQIRDHGPGLDRLKANRVFDPFYTTKPGGVGIGLTISRTIIEAHDGKLWVEPASPHGCIFQFTLSVLS